MPTSTWLTDLRARLTGRRYSRRPIVHKPRTTRLGVEELDDRVVPASLTTIATFDSTTGDMPSSRLMADVAGNLYGTTVRGGGGYGTVFKVPALGGAITTLATFD